MSRGRKAKTNNDALTWEQLASKNIGKYLQKIIIELAAVAHQSTESGVDLLNTIKAEKGKIKKEKELPPIKAEEILYAIPKNWAWCRLGEIGICKTGTTPSTLVKEYFGKDIPFIKPADITLRGLIYDNEGLSFSGLNVGVLVPSNSLMMVCIGGSIGKSFYNDIDVSCNQQINTITPLSGVKAQFLQYLMQSDYFQKAIWAKASGGTTPIVNRSKWESIPIPLLPLSEQEKILAFLHDFENDNLKEEGFYFNREVEQKIVQLHESQLKGNEITAELAHQRTLVKNLRQQLLQDAVQGKLVENGIYTEGSPETGAELLKRIQKEKAQLIKDKKLKKDKDLPPIKAEDVPFQIPENWVWCRLGEICTELLGGFAFDSTRYSKTETSNQVIRLGNVKPNQLVLDTSPVFINDEYAIEAIKARLQFGDILVTMTGTRAKKDYLFTLCLNQNDLATNDLFLNQRVGCFRFGKCIENHFINILLKNKKVLEPVFESSTGAANQANIGITALKDILIPLPPLSTQRQIVEKVADLMRLCDALDGSIAASGVQNEALLQQVLREALGNG